jgi:hypothetical protein
MRKIYSGFTTFIASPLSVMMKNTGGSDEMFTTVSPEEDVFTISRSLPARSQK